MQKNQELDRLSANLQAFSTLISQYEGYKQAQAKKEITLKISSIIETIKQALASKNLNTHSQRYKSLKAYFENLLVQYNETVEKYNDDSDDDEEENKKNISLKVVEKHLQKSTLHIPNEEEMKKEELKTLKEIKAVKKVLCEITSVTNMHIATQDDYIFSIEKTSECTQHSTAKAMKEVKKTTQNKRETKLSITKWISAGVGWLVGGPIGAIVLGGGTHLAQHKINKYHDKKLKEVEDA